MLERAIALQLAQDAGVPLVWARIFYLYGPYEDRRRLGDAFRVEARIVVWEADDVVKVPAGALFRAGDDWAVFRVESGRARLALVNLGHNNGLEAEILAGLSSGDEVILHPTDKISDGVRVSRR